MASLSFSWSLLLRVALPYVLAVLANLLLLHVYTRVGHRITNWNGFKHDRILIDSGAAGHVTWDRSMLINYKTYRVPEACSGATGVSYVLGVGDAVIPFVKEDGTVQEILIHGICYEPQIPLNLLSAELLRQQGIFFSSETQTLYRRGVDGGNETIAVTETVHELPWLKAPEVKEVQGDPNESGKSGLWSYLWQRVVVGDGRQTDSTLTHHDQDNRDSSYDEFDELVDKVDEQKRKIAALEERLKSVCCDCDRDGLVD
ncbi:hypothetical protein CKM354_001211600 [Cercospora kikuchii]|uniref:Retrovirus-related Pol polyprotein from transposon TNT 1-94-like beta-barrel domain-containing protein n=1 Tax=Cercospora kikuchii TaxID=84275 RepID=A0A9P3CUA8_9PEZI|nr:uncharacterized protein CKM354_001211600 [Cercospora kikuchii]GIZ49076.1 hypothetical protein CKM354_001211600 [Cercospora kikuchii]